MFKRLIHLIICLAFISNYCQPVYAQDFSINQLPVPGSMIGTTPAFVPLTLKGMVIHPENALKFDFLMDTGHSHLKGDGLSGEALKIMKYFLTALTIPEDDLWVNLSPYEKGRIIQDNFGQTIMGRDLLAQDYILKQLTSSLIYPEKALGKEFWQQVYSKAAKEYGTTQIPVNTFNKVWIVPSEAVVWEHAGKVLIVKSHLKVMLEEDYLSMTKHADVREIRGQAPNINRLGSEIVRRIVLPVLEKEVNEGKNFAQLRQMFQAMILATWYKKALKTSILNQVYTDKKKVAGIGYANSIDVEAIYQRYLKAFKKGAFNYIKEDIDPATGQTIPRKYFSGGFSPRFNGVTNFDHALVAWQGDFSQLSIFEKRDVGEAEGSTGDTFSFAVAFNEVGAKAPAEVGTNEDSAMIAPAIPYVVASAISLIGGGFVAKQIASAQEQGLLERKMISSLQRLTSSWDSRNDIEFLASNGTDPRVGPALLDVVRKNTNSANCAFAVLALLELRIFNDQLFNVLTERIRKEGSKSAEDPEFKVWQTMAEIRSHIGPRSSIPQGSDRAMLNVLPTSFLRLLGDRGLDSIVDRLDSGVESIRRNAKGALLEMLRYEEDPSKRQAVMEAIDRLPPRINSLEAKYLLYTDAVYLYIRQDVCVWAIHRLGELGRIQLEDLQLPPELKLTTEMETKSEGETSQKIFRKLEMLVESTLFKEEEYQEVHHDLGILMTKKLEEEAYPEAVQRLKGLMKLRVEENKYPEVVQQIERLIKLKFEEDEDWRQKIVSQLERYMNPPQYSQAEEYVSVPEKRIRRGEKKSEIRVGPPQMGPDMKLAAIEELVEFNDMTFLAQLAGMRIGYRGTEYYRVSLEMAKDVTDDFRVAAARIFVKKGGKLTLLSFLSYPNDSIRLDATTRLMEEREALNVSDDDLIRGYQEALQHSDNPAVKTEARKALDALHSKEGINGVESYVVSSYKNALKGPVGPITDEYYVKLAHAAQALGHLVDLKDEKAVEDAVEVLVKALNREIKPLSLNGTHRPHAMGTVFRKSHFDEQMEFFFETIMAIWRLKGPGPAKIELERLLAVGAINQHTISQIIKRTNGAVRIVQASPKGMKDSAMLALAGMKIAFWAGRGNEDDIVNILMMLKDTDEKIQQVAKDAILEMLNHKKEEVRQLVMEVIDKQSFDLPLERKEEMYSEIPLSNGYKEVREWAVGQLGALGRIEGNPKLALDWHKKVLQKLEALLRSPKSTADVIVATLKEIARLNSGIVKIAELLGINFIISTPFDPNRKGGYWLKISPEEVVWHSGGVNPTLNGIIGTVEEAKKGRMPKDDSEKLWDIVQQVKSIDMETMKLVANVAGLGMYDDGSAVVLGPRDFSAYEDFRKEAVQALVEWGREKTLFSLLKYPDDVVKDPHGIIIKIIQSIRSEAEAKLRTKFGVTSDELASEYDQIWRGHEADEEVKKAAHNRWLELKGGEDGVRKERELYYIGKLRIGLYKEREKAVDQLVLEAKGSARSEKILVINALREAAKEAMPRSEIGETPSPYSNPREQFFVNVLVALWELGENVERTLEWISEAEGKPVPYNIVQNIRGAIGRRQQRINRELVVGHTSPEVSESAAAADASQEVGGIALNAKLMDLQIKRDGHGVPLPISQQPLDRINIQGFVPQIISIQPVDLPALLGLSGGLTGASKDGIVEKI